MREKALVAVVAAAAVKSLQLQLKDVSAVAEWARAIGAQPLGFYLSFLLSLSLLSYLQSGRHREKKV